MSKLSMIVAKGENGVIGKDNELIWDIPEDLKYFKEMTLGKTIVMGRKTYDSIGRPLPGRNNVVVTRDASFMKEGVQVVSNIEEVLSMLSASEEVIVIGGDSIYKQFMKYATTLYVTEIYSEFEGDTFFPDITDEWDLTSSIKGRSDDYKYYFNKYEKQEYL